MKNFYWISLIILGLAIGLIVYVSYLLFFPQRIIEMRSPIKIINTDPIHAGDVVELQLDYCKKVSVTSDVEVVFANDSILPDYSLITNLPVGCNIKTFGVVLPIVAHPGTYVAAFKFTYNTRSPFRGQQYIFFSDPFTVASESGVKK